MHLALQRIGTADEADREHVDDGSAGWWGSTNKVPAW